MENQRLFVITALLFVLFLIYQAWVQDYGPKPEPAPQRQTATESSEAPGEDVPGVPGVPAAEPAAQPAPETAPAPKGEIVRITTDVISARINTAGGNLQLLALLKYPKALDNNGAPVELLKTENGELLFVQSGMRAANGLPAPGNDAPYTAARNDYRLAEGADELRVVLEWQGDGLRVEKIYTFRRDEYQVDLDYRVTNQRSDTWRGDAYLQLQHRYVPRETSMFDPSSFVYDGPAFHNGEKYQKVDFEELRDLNAGAFAQPVQGGWGAVLSQQYFLAAVIPPQDGLQQFYARTLPDNRYLLGFVLPTQAIAPGATGEFHGRMFLGPKLQDRLAEVAPGLERAVDYGMLTIIAEPLFWLLEKIHRLLGNWGWSIIILTVMIKLAFYKLSETSGRSMAKMRKIAPRLQTLKERYKDDRQRLNMAMMELYKQEKINPAAGCLPILVQLPVFIALYWVLLYSVELRQAPWILWIRDLSAADPYYVLPVLMGLAMFAQQKLNPPPPDPVQAKIFMFMPLVMVGFSAFFPSGLVLYWFVNTLLSAAQQWQINRVIENVEKKYKR